MLEKNKDYVEMRVSSTDCAFTQNAATQISVDGYVYTTYMNLPDPGEFYILISKEKFDRLQADNEHYRELAKQWEENYNLLFKKTGFLNLEDLMCYLPKDKTLKGLIDTLEADYISKMTKNAELQTENEQLKKKLHEFDPIPDYKELLKKLYPTCDVEKLEWTLNHVCGGQASVNGWMVTAKLWRRNYETLSKLVGFSSTEEIQDYLTNEAECDTLHGAISKLKDQVKYTCDEWYSANSSNNSWKAAAECNLPKELIEKIKGFRDEIGIYSRALKDWKEGTGCPSPSAAKTLIESQVSWCHAYDDVKAANEKLADDIKSWKNVTGYSTPEDYMHARINCAAPFDYTAAWQNFTGCDCAQEAGVKINNLCDEICKLKVDYDRLLKLTGYKSEDAIRVLLNLHEQFVYENMRELINSLKRKAKFTESNWQTVTGFSTPEKCSSYIDRLEKKLEDIKNLTEED